jgi:hypothetical protein
MGARLLPKARVNLDLSFLQRAGRPGLESAGRRRRLVEAHPVGRDADEIEDRRDGPIMIEAVAANLVAQEGIIRGAVRRGPPASFPRRP